MGYRPVREGLFKTDSQGRHRLIGGRCRACGRYNFPSHAVCPYCSSSQTERAILAGEGTLWAWTAVTSPPPGYQGELPFGFGVVELPEGIRVITRLTEADPGLLTFGQAMVLKVVPLHAGEAGDAVTTWAFAPADAKWSK